MLLGDDVAQIQINIPDSHDASDLQEIIMKRVHDYCWSGSKERNKGLTLASGGFHPKDQNMREYDMDTFEINIEEK